MTDNTLIEQDIRLVGEAATREADPVVKAKLEAVSKALEEGKREQTETQIHEVEQKIAAVKNELKAIIATGKHPGAEEALRTLDGLQSIDATSLSAAKEAGEKAQEVASAEEGATIAREAGAAVLGLSAGVAAMLNMKELRNMVSNNFGDTLAIGQGAATALFNGISHGVSAALNIPSGTGKNIS